MLESVDFLLTLCSFVMISSLLGMFGVDLYCAFGDYRLVQVIDSFTFLIIVIPNKQIKAVLK